MLSTLSTHYLIDEKGSMILTLQMRQCEHREIN